MKILNELSKKYSDLRTYKTHYGQGAITNGYGFGSLYARGQEYIFVSPKDRKVFYIITNIHNSSVYDVELDYVPSDSQRLMYKIKYGEYHSLPDEVINTIRRITPKKKI